MVYLLKMAIFHGYVKLPEGEFFLLKDTYKKTEVFSSFVFER
jgi:hypothetical protein